MLLAHHTNTALQNCALCHILLVCIVSQRQPHQSRSTGHGNAWTRPDSTRADEAPAPKRRQTERDTETAPTAEPPRDQAKKRTRQKNQSQHGSSSGDKTASRQPAPPEPQRSSQSQKSQKRGTVDHERRRAETERRRAEKERERRENDSKTPLFSPSHRTPSRSTARASPAPADMNGSRNAAFFGSAFVEYAELTEINASFDHTEGGDGSYFYDLTNAKNLALYPLLHASIFFTKTITSKTHCSSTIYFLTNINILCYRLLFGRMP